MVIDSNRMELGLPQDKLLRIRQLLITFLALKKVTLRELQSLLGLLTFAWKVIPMGRAFSKGLYRATCGFKPPFDRIRLTKDIKADLRIWLGFLESFNGCTLWKAILFLLRLLTYLRTRLGLPVTGPIFLDIGRLLLGLRYGLNLVFANILFFLNCSLSLWL